MISTSTLELLRVKAATVPHQKLTNTDSMASILHDDTLPFLFEGFVFFHFLTSWLFSRGFHKGDYCMTCELTTTNTKEPKSITVGDQTCFRKVAFSSTSINVG